MSRAWRIKETQRRIACAPNPRQDERLLGNRWLLVFIADYTAETTLRIYDSQFTEVYVNADPPPGIPITVTDLPPGEHAVVVDSDLGSIKQTVTIEAGNTASLTVPLAPEGAPVSGWMAISAPGVVELFEGGRLLGTSQSYRLMVSAGRHDIEIVSDALGFKVTRVVQVTAGKVTPIKVEFPKGTIALNATPWAEVWVDGEKIGDTPIGNYQLTLGSHDFVFRHPDLGEQRHTAMVTLKTPARLSVDLRKK